MFAHLKNSQNAARRGSVMIVTLMLSLALASVVMYSMSDSMTAQSVNQREGNYASALAAAEYGAELAIAELGRGLVLRPDADGRTGDQSIVVGDWVLGDSGGHGTLYSVGGTLAKDQRRIAGNFNDQEFRVRVRSARLAYDSGYVGGGSGQSLPDGWVTYPGEFEYGADKAYQFSDVYEITSTARHINAGRGNIGGRLAETPVVQALVSLKYSSFTDNMLDDSAVLHLEKPEHFTFTGGMTPVPDMDAPIAPGQPQTLKSVYNISITGEDHNLIKQHVEKVQTEQIVTPLKLTTNKQNFFGAYGTYWIKGHLTLNYRVEPETSDANPHRPKTSTFASSGDGKKMWVADKNRPYDTYLLGGKESRTVRLDETIWHDGIMGNIIENSSGQAFEGGAFNIVLGQFEDLRNLYINMAGVVGAYTDPTNWWQIYVGQYTHSRRGCVTTVTRSLPNYAGVNNAAKIRAQTIHLMKNADEQFLVRLYEKSGKYYKYPISGGKWTGKYCWATAVFGTNGLVLSKNVTASGNRPEEKSGQYAVGRSFFWQELVGYQLVRRGEKGISTDVNEPAVVEQRDLPVSGQKIDKRTIYRLYSDGVTRIPAGFDELYQGYDQREYSSTAHKHPLADSKYGGGTSPGYLQDRGVGEQPIVIQFDDGTTKDFPNMDSFLFKKEFEIEGETVERDALALFIGYEDQRETTADYNYTDMMFTIWISPQVEKRIVDRLSLASSSLHWWERDERDGLSGDTSHMSVSVNLTVKEESLPAGTTLEEAHYNLFNPTVDASESGEESLGHNIWTMRDDDKVITDFPRAVFIYEQGKYNTGVLDQGDEVVSRFIAAGHTTFYISNGDLNDYLRYILKDGTNDDVESWYDKDAGEWKYDDVLVDIQGVGANAGFTFVDIDKRWDMAAKNRESFENNISDSLMITSEPLSARQLAGTIAGMHRQNAPVIDTETFVPPSGTEAQMMTLGFIAGEMDLSVPVGNDWVHLGLPSSPPALGVRGDLLTFPEPDEAGVLRQDYVKGYFDVDPAKAVKMCYADFNAGDMATKKFLAEEYGLKEKRYSIGYHRGGTSKTLRDYKTQDHYEIVVLGQTGFNPYRESTTGKRYIANDLGYYDTYDAAAKVRKIQTNYPADQGTAPDFVFEDAIDGAGAMVINGNLIVKDTFAYYGTLIVLGDVRIIPTEKTEWIYNSDGRPVDEYGHALYLEDKVNESDPDMWYYIWERIDPDTFEIEGGDKVADKTYIQLDDDTRAVRMKNGSTIPVVPFTQKVYRGELAVQGNIVVKGRIYTEQIDAPTGNFDGFGNPITESYLGKFTAMWSREAVSNITNIWSQGSEAVSRVTWIHDDDVDVDSIWNNQHD